MIIGVVGFIGSGKDTLGKILINNHGFEKISFSDTLKTAISAIFGWDRVLLEGETEESRKFRETPDPYWSEKFNYNFTPRKALQIMGTEAGRKVFHDALWIYSLEKNIQQNKDYVITDVRFANEINFIKEKNGFIVRIKRGTDPDWYNHIMMNISDKERIMKEIYPHIHESEWNWIGTKYHYIIHNTFTLDMLEADIKHMLRVFRGPATIEKD